jgi:hypothetical protein
MSKSFFKQEDPNQLNRPDLSGQSHLSAPRKVLWRNARTEIEIFLDADDTFNGALWRNGADYLLIDPNLESVQAIYRDSKLRKLAKIRGVLFSCGCMVHVKTLWSLLSYLRSFRRAGAVDVLYPEECGLLGKMLEAYVSRPRPAAANFSLKNRTQYALHPLHSQQNFLWRGMSIRPFRQVCPGIPCADGPHERDVAYGYRLEWEGVAVCYSASSYKTEALRENAAGSDLSILQLMRPAFASSQEDEAYSFAELAEIGALSREKVIAYSRDEIGNFKK